MTRPLVLKTPKRRLWLLIEGDRYKPIAPHRLRMRLHELGLAALCRGLKGELRPSQILAEHGAVVSRAEYEAAERGAQ